MSQYVYNKHKTTWKLLSTVNMHLIVFVSEIERVSDTYARKYLACEQTLCLGKNSEERDKRPVHRLANTVH